MFRKKKEVKIPKTAVAIRIELLPCKEDQFKDKTVFEFDIPDGGSYEIGEFSDGLIIRDKNEDVIRKVRFQAGFTVSFILIYWKEPD